MRRGTDGAAYLCVGMWHGHGHGHGHEHGHGHGHGLGMGMGMGMGWAWEWAMGMCVRTAVLATKGRCLGPIRSRRLGSTLSSGAADLVCTRQRSCATPLHRGQHLVRLLLRWASE